jgi:inosine-uridine nucleoside N-ribohydrolase
MTVDHCTDKTLRVPSHIGAFDVPVYQGLSRPLVRHDLPIARAEGDVGSTLHGKTLPLPEAKMAAEATSAVEFLIETYRSTTEEITLIPVAPMSNIAAALALYLRLVDLIPEAVIMGGCHAFGNRTASAEFNIWADPEAAAMVLSAGFQKITLVPLDATYSAALSLNDCQRLESAATPASLAAASIRQTATSSRRSCWTCRVNVNPRVVSAGSAASPSNRSPRTRSVIWGSDRSSTAQARQSKT